MAERIRILFLCTGNACRSQMAEGWARHLKSDCIEAWSAGVEAHGLSPRAARAMAEAGVDISSHHSKLVNEVQHVPFDYVITVCSNAHERCPVFPGKHKIVHVPFDDPPDLVKHAKTPEEVREIYRRVRDQIRDFVLTLPESLLAPPKGDAL